MRIVKTHTGKIYVDKDKKLEFLTVGDYGKRNLQINSKNMLTAQPV